MSKTPDLFWTLLAREPAASPVSPVRHVLPKDLPNAIKQLGDDELKRLFGAVVAEQKRRGGKIKAASNRRQVEVGRVALTPSKINAVRAAFEAGIKASQISRQFGIPRAEVQKVLTSGHE